MATNIEQTLIEKVRALPPDKQQKLLHIVEDLEQQTALETTAELDPNRRPVWEIIEEISSQVPPEAWDEVPTDGSINVDHYLYGAPKKKS